MKQADFEELIESVREAGRILRDEAKPSREFQFSTPRAASRSDAKMPTMPSDDDMA